VQRCANILESGEIMANNIKGITVEIGGNTGPLNTALKGVNKTAGDLQSELKEVNKQLKFDPKNTTLLAQKQDLLKQSTETLKEKQAALKEAVEQAHAQFEKGNLGADKVRAVEREYAKVTNQLKDTEKQLKELESGTASFTDKVKGKFSEIGNSIKSAFNAENIKAGLGAAGVAAAGLLKSAIDSATAAEEKTGRITNLLQNQGLTADEASKQMGQFTSSITKMSAFSGGEAKDALQVLTEKGISSGEALENSALLANVAAGSHKTLAEAADLLADSYHGKTKALIALGILTKEEAKQLGDAEDATISMTTVQERLNERFGGAAQTQLGTYAGKMKENTKTINAAKSAIGTALLPVLAQVAETAAKVLVPVADFIKQHPKLTAGILTIIAVVGTLVGGMTLLNGILSTVSLAGATGLAAMLPTIGLVGAAVVGIAVAAALIITHWSGIKAFFKGLWDDIKGIFSGVGDWFTGIFTGAANGVKTAWNGIGSFFTGLWDGVKTVFTTAWNGIKTTVMTVVNVFVQDILNIWNSMKAGIENIMTGLRAILSGIWLAIKTVVLGPVLLILDLVTGNFKKLSSDSQGIFNNLKAAFSVIWSGIKQVFSGVVQAITGLVKTEWNGIKTFATTLWNSVGQIIKTAWSGFKTTISTLCSDISTGIKTVWNGIINWFKELPGKLKQIGIDMFTRMKEGINSTIHGVGDAVKTGISTAFDFIKNLPSEALQWGKDIINGIVNGIKSAAHAVGEAVQGVAQDIRKFLHFSVPDEGPLSDFDTYMPDMMHLMAEGITDNLGVVTDATRQVAGSIAEQSGKAVDNAVGIVKGRLGITLGSSTVMTDIGFRLGRGLSDGIDKSKTVVLKTAKNMSDLLTAEETRLQNQIAEIQKQTASQTQKSNEEILQDNLNAQLKIVQDFKKQYDDAIAEIEKAQTDMSNKLLAFGDLFTKTQSEFGDMFSVNDLQSQIDAINGYGDALEKLKARGVSDSLLDKVKDMSIEDATQYTTQLLSMTDEQYAKYMTLWDQKQQAAKSVAEKFYKGELDTLKVEYVDKIPSELSGIKDQMQDIGVLSGQGLAAGFASQSDMITATFVGVLQAAYMAAKESMDIHSPSRKWAYIGEQNAAGLGIGFVEKMKSVTKQMNDSIPTNIVLGSNETPSAARMSEGLVNGLAAVLGTQQGGAAAPGGTYEIDVMMPNGDVLASAVFDPLRSLTKQKGVALI